MKPINALYYPQTVCLNEEFLKYLILSFDRIYLLPIDNRLNPGHTSVSSRFSISDNILSALYGTLEECHYLTMYSGDSSAWDERLSTLMASYDWLEEKGLCVPLADARFFETYPLESAVESDLHDPEFMAVCERYQNEKFLLPSNVPQGKIKGGGLGVRPPVYPGKRGVTALLAERLNSTLYWAERHQAIPVTNAELFNRAYGAKLKRALVNRSFWTDRGAREQVQATTVSVLSWQLFQEVVPPSALQGKSLEELLSYKRETGELHEKYRDYVGALAAEISAEPWEERHIRQIDDLVKRKVIPEIAELKEKERVVWESMFGEIVKTAAKGGYLVPVMSLTMINGLSYADLLYYGVLAAIAKGGRDILAEILDMVVARRAVRRNALFFVLNLR